MQIKELKEVLNGQCEIIGFTLEDVESMIYDMCVNWFILNYGAFWNFQLQWEVYVQCYILYYIAIW